MKQWCSPSSSRMKNKNLLMNITFTANPLQRKGRKQKKPSLSGTPSASLPKDPPREHWQTLKLLFENMRESPTVLYTNSYFIRYTISNAPHALDACHPRIKYGSKAYESNANSTAWFLRKSTGKNLICCTGGRQYFSVQRWVFCKGDWDKSRCRHLLENIKGDSIFWERIGVLKDNFLHH